MKTRNQNYLQFPAKAGVLFRIRFRLSTKYCRQLFYGVPGMGACGEVASTIIITNSINNK